LERGVERELEMLKADFYETLQATRLLSETEAREDTVDLQKRVAEGKQAEEELRSQLADLMQKSADCTMSDIIRAAEEADAQRTAAEEGMLRAEQRVEELRSELRAARAETEEVTESLQRAEEERAQVGAKSLRAEELLVRERGLHETLRAKEHQLQEQQCSEWQRRELELCAELEGLREVLAGNESEEEARRREAQRRREEQRTRDREAEEAQDALRREHEREVAALLERMHQERASMMEERRKDTASAAEAVEAARAEVHRKVAPLQEALDAALSQLATERRQADELRAELLRRDPANSPQAVPEPFHPPETCRSASAPAEVIPATANPPLDQPQPPAYMAQQLSRRQLAMARRGSGSSAVSRSPRNQNGAVPPNVSGLRARSMSPPRRTENPAASQRHGTPEAETEMQRLQRLKCEMRSRLRPDHGTGR